MATPKSSRRNIFLVNRMQDISLQQVRALIPSSAVSSDNYALDLQD